MTTEEFSNEFDILLNSYLHKYNFGEVDKLAFDEYEKSVYLTKAQRIYIEGINFEKDEQARRTLEKLVVQDSLSVVAGGNVNSANADISTETVFYQSPTNLMKIVYEVLNITISDITKDINVVPIRTDEYHIQKNNPFKKPKSYGLGAGAWRLDYGGEVVSTLEIVPPPNVTINSYKVRYIKQPSPILLEDFSNNDVSIEGQNSSATCLLNDSCHYKILEIAVELALQDRAKFLPSK
jgi:hypothetical protein